MSFIENGSNASDYVSFISNMLYSCGQANVKVIEWPLYRVLGGGNSLITLDNSEAQVLFQTAAHHSCLLRNHVTSLVDVSHASNIKDFLNFAEEFQSIKDAVNFFPVHNSISHPMYKRKMRGNQLKFPSLVSPQTYNYQKVFRTGCAAVRLMDYFVYNLCFRGNSTLSANSGLFDDQYDLYIRNSGRSKYFEGNLLNPYSGLLAIHDRLALAKSVQRQDPISVKNAHAKIFSIAQTFTREIILSSNITIFFTSSPVRQSFADIITEPSYLTDNEVRLGSNSDEDIRTEYVICPAFGSHAILDNVRVEQCSRGISDNFRERKSSFPSVAKLLSELVHHWEIQRARSTIPQVCHLIFHPGRFKNIFSF